MRSLNTDTQTESEASNKRPVWFFKGEFDEGDLNLHTRLGTITWGGDTYTGTGGIGGISAVDEDSELSRSNLQLTLRGMPSDIVQIVLDENFQGRRATLYIGYVDSSGVLVDDPIIIYRGRMDNARIKLGRTFTVILNVESRFAAWDKPLVRRYNNADQQSRYPGDRGLEFIEQASEKEIFWGRKMG